MKGLNILWVYKYILLMNGDSYKIPFNASYYEQLGISFGDLHDVGVTPPFYREKNNYFLHDLTNRLSCW